MQKLKTSFRKNGIVYKLLERTDKTAFFELKLPTGEMAGYEVSRILVNSEREIKGRKLTASESITSNERFGYDGSKSFFPSDYTGALKYFGEFSVK